MLACNSSKANLANGPSSFVKRGMIGSKNTGCFFVSKFINHFLYVVPVTHKLHKLKIVPMTKIVVLISVQQKWTMSFICLGWYKNAKYAALLTDTVFKKLQFRCFSPEFSDYFLILPTLLRLFCTYSRFKGPLDCLSDV